MDQIILALDLDDADRAIEWVRRFRGTLNCFKVGSQIFMQHGPDLVRKIQDEGASVFLDLKWHDIPQTVAHAVEAAAKLNIRFATVHASGGSAMLASAAAAAAGSPLQLLAVTVLTSFDEHALSEIGVAGAKSVTTDSAHAPLAAHVLRLANLALTSGITGFVCSPHEITLLRTHLLPPPDEKICLVTPGVRPEGSQLGDQKRVMTPQQALHLGANHLVIGRPILQAPNPELLVSQILASTTRSVVLN